MKRDKFKKMKLEIQTLEPVSHPDNCVLLLSGVQMENPEQMELSIGQATQKKSCMSDGTILVGLEAKGIRTEDEKIRDFPLKSWNLLLETEKRWIIPTR